MFEDFIEKKDRELAIMSNPAPMDHAQESRLFGTKALTTRQPPSFHAALAFLERYIPLTDRGEIIHQAIESAYETLFLAMENDRSISHARMEEMRLLHCNLGNFFRNSIIKTDSDSDSDSAATVTEDERAKAVEALGSLGSMSDSEWLAKYGSPELAAFAQSFMDGEASQ